MTNPRKGIILAFLSLLLLGIMPVISNSRPQALNALNYALYLSLWQLACALPVMLIEYKTGHRGLFGTSHSDKISTQKRSTTLRIILITGFLFGISTYLYVLSFEKAGTVSAAIAIQAYPLFAILWETLFFKKKKSPAELGFTLLLVTGLYYLGTNGSWQIEGLSYWFLAALSVPFLWSIAHVIIKNMLDTTPVTPAQVTFFRVLVSSIILMIIAVLVNGSKSVLTGFMNSQFQIYALIMGVVYYLELMIWFYAVKHIDVSVASSITTPTPVITMILAALFLHESIEQIEVITMAVVFISIYGILYAGKRH